MDNKNLVFDTLTKIGENMKIDEIKCSQDVYKFMTNNIEYGWIDINENIHLNTMKEFRRIYRTMSIDEIPVGVSFKEFNKYINHVQ